MASKKAPSRTIHVVVECVVTGSTYAVIDAMIETVRDTARYQPNIDLFGCGEIAPGVHGSYGIKSSHVVEIREIPTRRAKGAKR